MRVSSPLDFVLLWLRQIKRLRVTFWLRGEILIRLVCSSTKATRNACEVLYPAEGWPLCWGTCRSAALLAASGAPAPAPPAWSGCCKMLCSVPLQHRAAVVGVPSPPPASSSGTGRSFLCVNGIVYRGEVPEWKAALRYFCLGTKNGNIRTTRYFHVLF